MQIQCNMCLKMCNKMNKNNTSSGFIRGYRRRIDSNVWLMAVNPAIFQHDLRVPSYESKGTANCWMNFVFA